MKSGRFMTMHAKSGRGGELADALVRVAKGLRGFPGCELYLISQDENDPDTVRVTEVWTDITSAEAALNAPDAGDSPKPADILDLLDGPPERVDVVPLGGVGLD